MNIARLTKCWPLLQGAAFRRFGAAVLNLPDPNAVCPATVPLLYDGPQETLGNESTTEPATSNNGQTSKSIKWEGRRKMSDVAFVTKRMAENSVGKKRMS